MIKKENDFFDDDFKKLFEYVDKSKVDHDQNNMNERKDKL